MGTGWAAGGTPGGRRRLGEVLVAGRVLTETQLDEALRVQREDKGRRRRLGEVIVALGLADEVQIARALSDQLGLPFLDLGSLPIPDETLAVLPRNVAQRHGAVPVTIAHDVLTVALADPTNVLALDDIRLATKLASVRTAVASAAMALGARGSDVLRLVISQGMRLVIIGVVIGVGLALVSTRIVKSYLYDVSTTDPTTFSVIALLLIGVAAVGCYIPARRATKVDPLVALRYE